MRFDSLSAKKLLPGQHLLVDGCPGLRLEATTTTRSWTYRYKNTDGRMKQMRLGAWPAMSLSKAVTAWEDVRAAKMEGQDPVTSKAADKAGALLSPFATCNELIQFFLSTHIDVERKPDGASSVRSAMNRLLEEEPWFANLRPADVQRSMAFKLLNDRRDVPMATKKLRGLLGQAWEMAHDAGRLDDNAPNWWRQVLHGALRSKGKVINGRHAGRAKRILTPTELPKFVEWAARRMPQTPLDGVVLYLYTGMRGVEIFGLRPEFITQEPDGWWITIPLSLLKMERDADIVDHRVPLMGRTLEIVQRRMAGARNGWLFWTNRGVGGLRQYKRSAFSSYVDAIQVHGERPARRSGDALCPVMGWSAHDLRRTARTLLSSLDCPTDVCEAIIGHKPAVLVSTYNLHTYDEQKRLWLDRLTARLDQLWPTGLPARP